MLAQNKLKLTSNTANTTTTTTTTTTTNELRMTALSTMTVNQIKLGLLGQKIWLYSLF